MLKERFFLNPKEEDGDPYESSQITALIANPSGIYGIYSYREVFSFDRFWGIGSGRNFALGAMYAAYGSRTASARRIAEIGVAPGSSSTRARQLPARVFSVAIAGAATSHDSRRTAAVTRPSERDAVSVKRTKCNH